MVLIIIFLLLSIIIIGLLIKFIKNKNYKSLIIMLIIIIIIVTIGLVYFVFTANENYKIIDSGYISDFDNMIISNINDYNEFMVDANEWNKKYKQKIFSSKYNEKYFENKSLALVFIVTGSSTNKFIGVDISMNDTILTVNPKIDYAKGAVTDDITGKLILVEIDKNITQIKVAH